MNQSLNALMKKLSWQQDELTQHLLIAEQETLTLFKQLAVLEEKTAQAYISTSVINPEFEINRLNFLTQIQQQNGELTIHLKNSQEVETKLKDKLQRVKSELRMLEKYIEREQISATALSKNQQEKAMDEWVIQRRSPL